MYLIAFLPLLCGSSKELAVNSFTVFQVVIVTGFGPITVIPYSRIPLDTQSCVLPTTGMESLMTAVVTCAHGQGKIQWNLRNTILLPENHF